LQPSVWNATDFVIGIEPAKIVQIDFFGRTFLTVRFEG